MNDGDGDLDRLDDLVARAKRAGADAADAVLARSTALQASWRMGRNEGVERAEEAEFGLRVFVGARQAVVSTTDLGAAARGPLVERALAMARAVPEDPHCGLPDAAGPASAPQALDLADASEPGSQGLLAAAQAAEDAARAVAGVTNSEGANASSRRSAVSLAASNGFAGRFETTRYALSAAVVAGADTAMERDYDWRVARHREDLEAPETVGRRAGERAVARLGPRKRASARVPVVFDPRVSAGLMRLLANLASGADIARGTSCLRGRRGEPLFAPGVTVVDDPHRARGLSSRPFDGEGLAGGPLKIVEDGALANWLLDSRSARQLGLSPTGNAARGPAGTPSPAPSNFYMAPGSESPEALVGAIESGFYVTEMMGMSFNYVTGDYSRGASGFWIEKGEIAYPVSEMTVAGNILDMFPAAVPADDLEFRYGVDAPTLRVDGMTVAGL